MTVLFVRRMKVKQYVLSARQMKQYDRNTIEKIGIPGMVLMERAALAVAEEACAYAKRTMETGAHRMPFGPRKPCRVLVTAGCGNNGGDGIAAARLLAERGMDVDVVLIGEEEKCSPQTKQQINILRSLGMDILRNFENREYDIIIDALFGIGLTRQIEGKYAEAVQKMNASNAYKISVDIPSGVETDSAGVMGCAVKADKTVTFGFLKKGLCLYPGKEYAGEVVCAHIGITEKSFLGEEPDTFTCFCSGKELLPKRSSQGNKGTFGKVLIVAGSRNMAGAAILCAKAAYRMGAGMVKLVTCEENRQIIQESLPEALLLTYTETSWQEADFTEQWKASVDWADAYVIGCGLGQGRMVSFLLKDILDQTQKPAVLDADALNYISRNPGILVENGDSGAMRIMTPHLGELSRLLAAPIEEIQKDLCGSVLQAAKRYHCIMAGKDAVTAVASPKGQMYLNPSGNSGMATAGSGDALAGMIGGLLAQKEEPYDAAWKGVYLHGLSGDAAAAKKGEHAVMASDIIEALPEIISLGG